MLETRFTFYKIKLLDIRNRYFGSDIIKVVYFYVFPFCLFLTSMSMLRRIYRLFYVFKIVNYFV